MQTATVFVALGGDTGNTVPKSGVTPGEIAILRAIHGNDAVFDIEPGADVERSNREEIERLRLIYRTSKVLGTDTLAVNALFPGVGARVPLDFDDLGLDDTLYKAETRAKPKAAAKKDDKSAKTPNALS